MNVRTLGTTIVKNGFTYKLIERTEDVAIYEQRISESRRMYEVFRIKTYSPKRALAGIYRDKGKSISSLPDLKELYPSDNDFGKTAFIAFELGRAYEIFEQLKPDANGKSSFRNWKKAQGVYA